MKQIISLLLVFSVFSAFGQSGAQWAAYKRANGIDPRWTYNAWVAAGCPRSGGGNNNSGQGNSVPSAADIAQQQRNADAAAQKNLAKAAMDRGDYTTAEAAYKKCLEYWPTDPSILMNIAKSQNEQGVAAYNKKDFTTALKYFQEALANDPDTDTDKHVIRNNVLNAEYAIGGIQQEQEQRQHNQATANNIQQSIQHLVQSLNTAPASGELDFMPVSPSSQTTPDSDPMVVDARNVPSGLPKSLDNVIPHTPAGERVRKGFEAIQAGDWKVALAWFQDALNKEPGNPGLQRLVDLAQFTLVFRAQAQTPTAGNNSASAQSTQTSAQTAAVNSTENPATELDEKNTLVITLAEQAAAAKRAHAAWVAYTKKYGDQDGFSIDRFKAIQGAERGDGYTDEELKAQLKQAIKEWHQKYDGKDPWKWEGTPNATDEEIIFGGKG